VSLTAFGLIGAQLRGLGPLCSVLGGIVGVTVLAGATGGLAALMWASRHRCRVEELVASLSATCDGALRAVARRVGAAVCGEAADPAGEVGLIDDPSDQRDHALGLAGVAGALALAAANWAADILALAIAFVALGLAVPWRGLLLAYAHPAGHERPAAPRLARCRRRLDGHTWAENYLGIPGGPLAWSLRHRGQGAGRRTMTGRTRVVRDR
jgi:pimeloyl-ACP methyl ester carboxylesterase